MNIVCERRNIMKVIHCRYCNFPNEYAQAEDDGKYCCWECEWECEQKENKFSDNNKEEQDNSEELYLLKHRGFDAEGFSFESSIGIYTYSGLKEKINNAIEEYPLSAYTYIKIEINKSISFCDKTYWAYIPKDYQFSIDDSYYCEKYISFAGKNIIDIKLEVKYKCGGRNP
jgi:hypothetical protein